MPQFPKLSKVQEICIGLSCRVDTQERKKKHLQDKINRKFHWISFSIGFVGSPDLLLCLEFSTPAWNSWFLPLPSLTLFTSKSKHCPLKLSWWLTRKNSTLHRVLGVNKGCSKDVSVRGACSHPSTPYCPRVQVCIISTDVLQMNCWPDLPCPTCLWWLLLKKSIKISQCNMPRRGVTSGSLPKLPSHCNTRPRCEMSIWWFPGFNYAGADRVLGSGSAETSLLPTTSVTKHHSTQCLSGDPQHEAHAQSQRLSDTHLRIPCIASALRFCLITRAGLSPVHNNKESLLKASTR